MHWSFLRSSDRARYAPFCLLLLMLLLPLITANNACDWTGSGLSATRHNRDIVSVYLRCSAGKITWKYPKGAIRIVLRPTFSTDSGFRVCLKMAKSDELTSSDRHSTTNDLKSNTKHHFGRIYLSAGKRLIPFDTSNNHNKRSVRCFNSVRDQATIYVEAEEMPLAEKVRIVFEYNLESVNKQPYSMRSNLEQHSVNKEILLSQRIGDVSSSTPQTLRDDAIDLTMNAKSLGAIAISFWNRIWDRKKRSTNADANADKSILSANKYDRSSRSLDIINELGDSWELCRPCSDMEMIESFCTSDIVVRGNIFSVQERDDLETNEIIIGETKILSGRNHVHANENTSIQNGHWKRKISYHTHRHCPASSGNGEFVFMGRLRFNEIMLTCAPRLEEWANIVYRYTSGAPCILSS